MELAVEFIRHNQTATEFLLYFLFFSSLARASLYRHFREHTGTLSIGLGAALAAALLLAKHRLGYSLDALGEPAVALIILVIAVVAYRFLTWSEAPTPVALLAALVLAAIALNAALPDWQVTRQAWFGPALIILLLLSAAGLVATTHGGATRRIAEPLTRAGLLPKRGALRKETNILRKSDTKKIGKKEQRAERQLRRATREIQETNNKKHAEKRQTTAGGPRNAPPPPSKIANERDKKRILKRIETAEREANKALHQLIHLQRIDQAIERFDLAQLGRAANANLAEFTPEQRTTLKRNLHEERQRINLEQHLGRLAHATEHTIVTLRGHLENATSAINKNNLSAAEGWLEKATETLRYTRHTSQQIQQLRAQLIRSLQRQVRATR